MKNLLLRETGWNVNFKVGSISMGFIDPEIKKERRSIKKNFVMIKCRRKKETYQFVHTKSFNLHREEIQIFYIFIRQH